MPLEVNIIKRNWALREGSRKIPDKSVFSLNHNNIGYSSLKLDIILYYADKQYQPYKKIIALFVYNNVIHLVLKVDTTYY